MAAEKVSKNVVSKEVSSFCFFPRWKDISSLKQMILYKGEINNVGKLGKTAESLSLNMIEGTGSSG